jgi:xanthosine utilization system XapX-like protein
MTVYLLAVAIAVALISFVKWCWLRWGIVLGLFVLGLTYDNAKSLFGFTLPWDADVALVAICYVYVGYQLFGWVKRHLNCWWLIGLIFSQAIFFIWAQAQNKMHFVLYMKSHQIAGPTFLSSTELALLLPVIFSIGVFVIAHWVAATPLLPLFRFIGQHTLVVMYWHKLIFTVLKQFSWDSPVLLISCGLLIPLLLAWCQQGIQHLWQRDAWLWRPFRQHRYGKVGVMKSVH